ncbi:MAG TPA: M48 family metallopeptidase [Acidimicrobiales bacterium]|nr:M48 family metallopeptidase [Acidimicrobiales bacterium]
MAIEAVRRYEQISAKAYEHPADRAATSALHTVPLLDAVVKRLTDLGHERQLRQVLMGSAVRLGEDQLPQIWRLYDQSARILDLDTVPPLYVTNNPMVNAMTAGARNPIVLVRSSLVADYSELEIQSVLAHEASHVLSEHYFYTTALIMLAEFLRGSLPRSLVLGLPVRAMYLALFEWHRAAELSADRASALVMGDPLDPCRMLMRLAGGALPEMNFDAFLRQATEYVDEEDVFGRFSRFSVELTLTHPFAVRRVRELIEWVRGGDYDRIRAGEYPRRGQEPPPSAEFNSAVRHYRERFNRFLGRTADDVQRLGRQFSEWLNRRGPGTAED